MDKYNKEEQEFLDLFSKESAAHDSLFKANLKQKMLKQLEPRFNIFSIFSMAGFSFMAMIIFSFITVISGFYFVSEAIRNQEVKSVTISSDQVKQEVVEKVAEKTSVTALKLLQVEEFLSNDSIEKPEKPVDETYNLKTTEVTFVPKKQAAIVCSNLNLPRESTVTQLYEYFDEDRTVSKITRNDETIALVEFNNFEQESPISFPVSMPTSFPVKQNEIDILDFNNNFELIETSSNTSKTFIINDFVEFECGNNVLSYPASFTVVKDKIIREFILNKDYSISKVNLYLNQISNANKLAEVTISASTQNISDSAATELLTDRDL